jgi:hypothetical protein
MRVVAVILEIAASGLTKIPISDQVGFLSSRFTAQSRPQELIVPKNRARRERINLRPTRSLGPTCKVLVSFIAVHTPIRPGSSLCPIDVANSP